MYPFNRKLLVASLFSGTEFPVEAFGVTMG
jgi:hypothetical protein